LLTLCYHKRSYNYLKSPMKSFLSCCLLSLVFLLPVTSKANDFEAALTSETAQFTFRSDSSLIGWGGAELGLGIFYNEASDFVGQMSLMQRRQATKNNPLTLGVGARLYLGDLDDINQNISAVAIGGEIRYTIPGVMPMAIYLTGHFAPQITSFSDTKEIVDYNLGFQIEILPQTTAFVGYRSLQVDVDRADGYDLDDDRIHVGVRFTF
jgi:hypothetical protein